MRLLHSAQSRNLRHAVTPSASELAAKHCLKRIAAAKSRGKGPLQPSGDVTRHLLLTSGAKKVIVLGDYDASGYAHPYVTARLGEANAP